MSLATMGVLCFIAGALFALGVACLFGRVLWEAAERMDRR